MSNFLGNEKVHLQPLDTGIGYNFILTTCTSGVNDGFLAYDVTGDSVSVNAFKTADSEGRELLGGITTASGLIHGTPSIENNIVHVKMSFPTLGAGYYKLTMAVSCSDGSVTELDYNRVYAHDN